MGTEQQRCARNRISDPELTKEYLEKNHVTLGIAHYWRDLYRDESARRPYNPITGRGNPSAAGRYELMQHVASFLGREDS